MRVLWRAVLVASLVHTLPYIHTHTHTFSFAAASDVTAEHDRGPPVTADEAPAIVSPTTGVAPADAFASPSAPAFPSPAASHTPSHTHSQPPTHAHIDLGAEAAQSVTTSPTPDSASQQSTDATHEVAVSSPAVPSPSPPSAPSEPVAPTHTHTPAHTQAHTQAEPHTVIDGAIPDINAYKEAILKKLADANPGNGLSGGLDDAQISVGLFDHDDAAFPVTVEIESDADAQVVASRDGHRTNYASATSGAVVLAHNPEMTSVSSLLSRDADAYALSRCSARKWVVIQLSEAIAVDEIIIVNEEKYSSTLRAFRLLGSTRYPASEWVVLGNFSAANKLGPQRFRVNVKAFVSYIKIVWLSHYGSEFYCTWTRVMVHGSTVLEAAHSNIVSSEAEVLRLNAMTSGAPVAPTLHVQPHAGPGLEHATPALNASPPPPRHESSSSPSAQPSESSTVSNAPPTPAATTAHTAEAHHVLSVPGSADVPELASASMSPTPSPTVSSTPSTVPTASSAASSDGNISTESSPALTPRPTITSDHALRTESADSDVRHLHAAATQLAVPAELTGNASAASIETSTPSELPSATRNAEALASSTDSLPVSAADAGGGSDDSVQQAQTPATHDPLPATSDAPVPTGGEASNASERASPRDAQSPAGTARQGQQSPPSQSMREWWSAGSMTFPGDAHRLHARPAASSNTSSTASYSEDVNEGSIRTTGAVPAQAEFSASPPTRASSAAPPSPDAVSSAEEVVCTPTETSPPKASELPLPSPQASLAGISGTNESHATEAEADPALQDRVALSHSEGSLNTADVPGGETGATPIFAATTTTPVPDATPLPPELVAAAAFYNATEQDIRDALHALADTAGPGDATAPEHGNQTTTLEDTTLTPASNATIGAANTTEVASTVHSDAALDAIVKSASAGPSQPSSDAPHALPLIRKPSLASFPLSATASQVNVFATMTRKLKELEIDQSVVKRYLSELHASYSSAIASLARQVNASKTEISMLRAFVQEKPCATAAGGQPSDQLRALQVEVAELRAQIAASGPHASVAEVSVAVPQPSTNMANTTGSAALHAFALAFRRTAEQSIDLLFLGLQGLRQLAESPSVVAPPQWPQSFSRADVGLLLLAFMCVHFCMLWPLCLVLCCCTRRRCAS